MRDKRRGEGEGRGRGGRRPHPPQQCTPCYSHPSSLTSVSTLVTSVPTRAALLILTLMSRPPLDRAPDPRRPPTRGRRRPSRSMNDR
eukprot:2038334-Pyramimonas_sp.AAC.1